jgi:BirA family transcriptional regulator, biotin operon repressor / biotin---[acetyl-CoA-carboxylase] ligase
MKNLRKILENSFVSDMEHHVEINSTNDRALECAVLDRVKLPFLIVADRQTAGRGRGSNRWWTGPGSLAFSLLIGPIRIGPARIGAAGSRTGLVALAVGVAVVDALAPLVPGHEIGIHWPNDVMLDSRKLAGILIEVLPDGKHIVGVGINTNNTATDAPPEVRPRVVTLRDVTGREHDSAELLIAILRELERLLTALADSPANVAARTHDLCLQRGRRLAVVQGAVRHEGRCLGIAADGALLLDIRCKPHSIYSGVVSQL